MSDAPVLSSLLRPLRPPLLRLLLVGLVGFGASNHFAFVVGVQQLAARVLLYQTRWRASAWSVHALTQG
jgi:hypothetical protein